MTRRHSSTGIFPGRHVGAGDSRVVDQDVDGAGARLGLAKRCVHRIRVGNIDLDPARRATPRPVRLGFLHRSGIEIPDVDGGAGGLQPLAIARPNPWAPPVTIARLPFRSMLFMELPFLTFGHYVPVGSNATS